MTGLVHLDAVTWMTARGWRLLPVRAGGKEPLTPHGVKDATTDPNEIKSWLRRWPDLNWAVATGAPGPQVLDVDDPTGVPAGIAAWVRNAPQVATVRGGHAYGRGTDQGTIKLPFGELRGRGSYVLVPPSTHPSGKQYVWLSEPRGPLPPVPALLTRTGRRAGCGEHTPPPRRIIAGDGRYPYLQDFAVRLVRACVTDPDRILAHLRCEFDLSCEPLPPPERGKLEALARWASESRIAERERDLAGLAALIRQRREEQHP